MTRSVAATSLQLAVLECGLNSPQIAHCLKHYGRPEDHDKAEKRMQSILLQTVESIVRRVEHGQFPTATLLVPGSAGMKYSKSERQAEKERAAAIARQQPYYSYVVDPLTGRRQRM